MKQGKLLFSVFIALAPVYKGYAIEQEGDSLSTKYELHEEWYLQLQGGINYMAAENTRFVNFWEVLSPEMAFSLGKRFSSVWGARMQFVAGKDKGVYYAHDKNSPKFSFEHHGVLGVGSFNLTEFLNRKKNVFPEKKWNVSVLLGLGVLYTSFGFTRDIKAHILNCNNGTYLSFGGGVEVARSLSPHWEATFELSTNWMNNRYNGQVSDSKPNADGFVNMLVGMRYTFKSVKKKSVTKAIIYSDVLPAPPLLQKREKLKAIVINEPPFKPAPIETYYSIEELLDMVNSEETIQGKKLSATERVFFDFGKSHIKAFSSIYLDKVVELMDKTSIVLVITGYITDKDSERLTEQRMKAVRNYLLKSGIERDRLVYQYTKLSGTSSGDNEKKQIIELGILSL